MYLKITDVAKKLAVSGETIRAWCQDGLLPHVRIGGTIRFHEDDLEKFLEKKRTDSCAPKLRKLMKSLSAEEKRNREISQKLDEMLS